MKKIKYLILIFGIVFGFGVVGLSANVSAADPFADACKDTASESALCKDLDKDKAPAFVKTLVNLLLYVLGAVSLVVIIFSGIFFTTSIGNPESIKKAKNTLLYAVVGLIVAVSAYAIVNYVVSAF